MLTKKEIENQLNEVFSKIRKAETEMEEYKKELFVIIDKLLLNYRKAADTRQHDDNAMRDYYRTGK